MEGRKVVTLSSACPRQTRRREIPSSDQLPRDRLERRVVFGRFQNPFGETTAWTEHLMQ